MLPAIVAAVGCFWTWGIMHNFAVEAAKRRASYTGRFSDFTKREVAAAPNGITAPNMSFTLTALGLLILALTAAGFRFASEYQGVAYAWTVTAVNVLVPLVLLAAYRANRSMGPWPIAFGSCWLLCAWIGSYAFAYLGELP